MKARIPKGMGAGPQNMQAMLKQAQKMQEDMQLIQEKLDGEVHEISAGGSAVTVKIKGTMEILEINIADDIVDPDDVETLEDLIVAAVNEAIKTVEKHNKEELGKVTAGIGMPGGIL
ncbi:MAG: YbaB/EbfC family nucleoid-associated protein [Clostridia bacterium]|nr:YbaB/EbfC family nucleoid-associated protein [Clostridia bacterium]